MVAPLRSLRRLDEVQHLHQLEAFALGSFLEALTAEVGELPLESLDQLGQALDTVGGVLAEVDRFAQKSMGIRLTHALATAPLPPQLRTLLTATVLSYQHDLPLLRGRVGAVLARLDRKTGGEVTERVMAAAERVLSARAELRDGVLGLARGLAERRLPAVQAAARSRQLDVPQRAAWARARIDLEALIASPAALATGSFAERVARLPPPPDEPEPVPDVSRFSLLEID